MRNAEKYLSQGKIRQAISEYKQVVDNEPKDFSTLNMLGDLYVKDSNDKDAVKCYSGVAEHYAKQGFAAKAIAIYNKISRIEPNSIEVTEKLAELYQMKGSVTEAKSHYETLAEHYQKQGKTVEALAIWKQIAVLDNNNTEVYFTIANSFYAANDLDEAADAFVEAGLRLRKVGRHTEALSAINRALDIKPTTPKVLTAFVESSFEVGRANEAAVKLKELLADNPDNREILLLIIDCQIKAGQLSEAEANVVHLVEVEPANYPKFLELAEVYLAKQDVESATRLLTISSEHLLVGGQAAEFSSFVNEILEIQPDMLDAIRLLERFTSWQRDDEASRKALQRLAEAAKRENSVEDERHALSQLVMLMPQSTEYAERLKVINSEHGFDDDRQSTNLFDRHFFGVNNSDPVVEAKKVLEEYAPDFALAGNGNNGNFEIANHIEVKPLSVLTDDSSPDLIFEPEDNIHTTSSDQDYLGSIEESPESKFSKELDSIKFYFESGYGDLAEKALEELKSEFGERPEISALMQKFGVSAAKETTIPVQPERSAADANKAAFEFDELRSELGLEDNEAADDSDYETVYNTAVAYKEMGLVEQAIREFQDAAGLVKPNDGSRRFFACANMLGHCFMEIGKPNLATTWHKRSLEIADLSPDEKLGVWYELADSYEADGDIENAGKYFELIYAEDINFRDVNERLNRISITA